MEGGEPRPQHISEVGFQIRTMKEKAPQAGCAGAGGLTRVWRAAAQMCKVASVHTGRSPGNSWAPSRSHTCQRLGGAAFLELGGDLASAWSAMKLPGAASGPGRGPRSMAIGTDVPLRHGGWDSLTRSGDQPGRRSSLLSSNKECFLGQATRPVTDFLCWHRTACCVGPRGW